MKIRQNELHFSENFSKYIFDSIKFNKFVPVCQISDTYIQQYIFYSYHFT